MKKLIAVLILFGGLTVTAQEPSPADKARLRLYDGGIDEQPLQVQANLYNPRVENEKTGEGDVAPTPVRSTPMSVDEIPTEE
jgi:hypothetical protein